MGFHDPFGHLTQVMAKRRVGSQKSNWQFDSRPLKTRNFLDFLPFKWRATYRWKDLDKGYNFDLEVISIDGLHAKLWAPKVARVPTLGISRFPLWSPRTK
jgi:hypothetical protein